MWHVTGYMPCEAPSPMVLLGAQCVPSPRRQTKREREKGGGGGIGCRYIWHVLVLLETDGPPERDVLTLDRDAVVAVVEDHLDVSRHDRHPDPFTVEQLGPLLVAKRGVHVAEYEPDREKEVALARPVPANDDLQEREGARSGERSISGQVVQRDCGEVRDATRVSAKRLGGHHNQPAKQEREMGLLRERERRLYIVPGREGVADRLVLVRFELRGEGGAATGHTVGPRGPTRGW